MYDSLRALLMGRSRGYKTVVGLVVDCSGLVLIWISSIPKAGARERGRFQIQLSPEPVLTQEYQYSASADIGPSDAFGAEQFLAR